MADPERDEKVSAGYRALGREAPSAALDAAIIAAASRRQTRWRIPVSIAAVLVLAAGVTLRMQQEQPDAESAVPARRAMEARRPASSAQDVAPARSEVVTAAKPAAPASAPAAGPVLQSRAKVDTAAKLAEETLTPETWLERIAELRKTGRAREADESYAAFKRKYPDYRIPAAMLGKVAPAQ